MDGRTTWADLEATGKVLKKGKPGRKRKPDPFFEKGVEVGKEEA